MTDTAACTCCIEAMVGLIFPAILVGFNEGDYEKEHNSLSMLSFGGKLHGILKLGLDKNHTVFPKSVRG